VAVHGGVRLSNLLLRLDARFDVTY
jgi:hypothetical protein